MFLTQESGFLLGPITNIFGSLMNLIYETVGFSKIGIAIIIFTVITRLILHPLTVRQQKSSKIMQFIQPEIKAVQKKYEGKTDQYSLMQQQQEMKAIYEKYGTSMTGGCVQLLIQLPIIIALYRVIMNIPAYVISVKQYFLNIVDTIGGINAIPTLQKFAEDNNLTNIVKQVHNFGFDDINKYNIDAQKNFIIDFLYKLNPTQWTSLINNFNNANTQIIEENLTKINETNSFLGLNLATPPSAFGFTFNIYLLVPIFAFLSQYLASQLMQKQTMSMQNQNDENSQMNQTMKTMNIMMPLMSAWFCYSLATGIGLYWIVSALLMTVQQLIVSNQMNNIDIDTLIKKNIEKANIKRQKKGQPLIDVKKTIDKVKKMDFIEEQKEEQKNKKLEGKEEKEKLAQDYYFNNDNKDSLFAKANMVAKFNEKQSK